MVYDSWSPDHGVDYRESPSLDARILGQLSNGSRVTIAENKPMLGSGLDGHGTYRRIAAGSRYRVRMWLPNKYLLDDPEPCPPGSCQEVPGPLDIGFRFLAPPVAIASINRTQGFGANRFAYNHCGAEGITCDPYADVSSCPYRSTRGIHNGLDFVVPDGTVVYWTGSAEGLVVGAFPSDGSPNIVVSVGATYYVVFGHLEGGRLVEKGDWLQFGMPIGRTGSPQHHLHMGVRTGAKFLNPLYFFKSGLAGAFTDQMGGYIDGEGPWSMRAYTYSTGRCRRYFWECVGCEWDKTGIDR